MFKGVAMEEVLCYFNSWIQEVWVGNSKKKKTERLEVPDHEHLCQALWGLLAQNTESVRMYKKEAMTLFIHLFLPLRR